MREKNGQKLTILINTKYARITIHRHTLKALGDPAYIHWGYHPQNKVLLLFGNGNGMSNVLKVYFTQKGTCYIHSKALIEGLHRASGAMPVQGSYLLLGKMDEKLSAISFPLERAKRLLHQPDKLTEKD